MTYTWCHVISEAIISISGYLLLMNTEVSDTVHKKLYSSYSTQPCIHDATTSCRLRNDMSHMYTLIHIQSLTQWHSGPNICDLHQAVILAKQKQFFKRPEQFAHLSIITSILSSLRISFSDARISCAENQSSNNWSGIITSGTQVLSRAIMMYANNY